MKFYLKQFLLFLLCLIPLQMSASEVDDVDILVELDSVGGAKIWETWTVNVSDEITEWYLGRCNFGNMEISSFDVFDEDSETTFAHSEPWNVDRSRSDKAGQCGMVDKGGNDRELCWGVGSNGLHHWTVSYYVSGFVKQYSDACGFNHMFVNRDMNPAPKHVRLEITRADSVPFTNDNARIWAFNFKGSIVFNDSNIVAESSEPLTSDNAMTIMCIFPKTDFVSANVVNDTIGTMKWKALDGSDYVNADNEEEDMEWYEYVIIGIILIIFCIICYFAMQLGACIVFYGLVFACSLLWDVVSFRLIRKWLHKRKMMKGAVDSFYMKPALNGNLHRTYSILCNNTYSFLSDPSSNDLISAYMVRLIMKGAFKLESTQTKKNEYELALKVVDGFYGMDGTQTPKSLGYKVKELEDKTADSLNVDEKCEELIYRIIYLASGEDKILQEKELEKWSRGFDYEMLSYLKHLIDLPEKEETPTEYQQVFGLKNYLKNIDSDNVKGVEDSSIWDENLVFATLFDIRKDVVALLKDCNPEYIQNSIFSDEDCNNFYSGYHYYNLGHIINDISSISHISDSSSASDGFGGGSSSGGGGGCSGGGGGGGR